MVYKENQLEIVRNSHKIKEEYQKSQNESYEVNHIPENVDVNLEELDMLNLIK